MENLIKKRERPSSYEGEDRAIDDELNFGIPKPESKRDKGDVDSLKSEEQKHKHKIESEKLLISSVILVVCFLIIISFSVTNACYKIDSTLFTGAFEFAKTIATTLIGYLFAVNTKDK